MNRKKIFRQLRLACEILLLAAMTGLSLWMLYGYLQEGAKTQENAAGKSGESEGSGQSMPAEGGAAAEETSPAEYVYQTGAEEDSAAQETSHAAGAGSRSESAADTKAGDLLRPIRVRILGNHYAGEFFQTLTVTCASAFSVTEESLTLPEKNAGTESGYPAGESGESETVWQAKDSAGTKAEKISWFEAGEACTLSAESAETGCVLRLAGEGGAPLAVSSLERDLGVPEYYGILLVYFSEDGLALVNELPLEQYLYAVVPSEMPSSYPAEAQKAQAVCARTVAWNCMRVANEQENSGEIPADLDDSVNFQVYNNVKGSEAARLAVDETAGEILPLENVLYYSTSCLTWDGGFAKETVFRAFLQQEPEETAEYGSPWLRWQTELSAQQLLLRLKEDYGILAEQIEEAAVTKRQEDGEASALRILTGTRSVTLNGAQEIRQFLAPGEQEVLLRDGTSVTDMKLLPSAYFVIDRTEEDSFRVSGGGFGHGQGMSQYGAAQMAAEGAGYREILRCYYGTEPETAWKESG